MQQRQLVDLGRSAALQIVVTYADEHGDRAESRMSLATSKGRASSSAASNLSTARAAAVTATPATRTDQRWKRIGRTIESDRSAVRGQRGLEKS